MKSKFVSSDVLEKFSKLQEHGFQFVDGKYGTTAVFTRAVSFDRYAQVRFPIDSISGEIANFIVLNHRLEGIFGPVPVSDADSAIEHWNRYMSEPYSPEILEEKTEVAYTKSPDVAKLSRGTEDAAGMDLQALERTVLVAGKVTKVDTGVAVAIPKRFYGDVRLRSGFASKNSCMLCSSGVVDADYRGNIFVPVINLSGEAVVLEAGQRFAQLLILPVPTTMFVHVPELKGTERGENGFGSTGS